MAIYWCSPSEEEEKANASMVGSRSSRWIQLVRIVRRLSDILGIVWAKLRGLYSYLQ